MLQEFESAVNYATKALEVKPRCFEAYYARARAKRDNHQSASALDDVKEATRLAPNNRDNQRLLTKIRDECRDQARFEGESQGGSRQSLTDLQRKREETAL